MRGISFPSHFIYSDRKDLQEAQELGASPMMRRSRRFVDPGGGEARTKFFDSLEPRGADLLPGVFVVEKGPHRQAGSSLVICGTAGWC